MATHGGDVVRPLLGLHKKDLLDYAQRNNLAWREDSTNSSERYLRNRIRSHVHAMDPSHKKELLRLREKQKAYAHAIQSEVESLVGEGPQYSRYFFTHMPRAVAVECIRHITEARLTRPQAFRAWHAIKTAKPGKRYEAGNGVDLRFSTRNFMVSLVK